MNHQKNTLMSKWIYWWALAYVILSYVYLFIPAQHITIQNNNPSIMTYIQMILSFIINFLPLFLGIISFIMMKFQKDIMTR